MQQTITVEAFERIRQGDTITYLQRDVQQRGTVIRLYPRSVRVETSSGDEERVQEDKIIKIIPQAKAAVALS